MDDRKDNPNPPWVSPCVHRQIVSVVLSRSAKCLILSLPVFCASCLRSSQQDCSLSWILPQQSNSSQVACHPPLLHFTLWKAYKTPLICLPRSWSAFDSKTISKCIGGTCGCRTRQVQYELDTVDIFKKVIRLNKISLMTQVSQFILWLGNGGGLWMKYYCEVHSSIHTNNTFDLPYLPYCLSTKSDFLWKQMFKSLMWTTMSSGF